MAKHNQGGIMAVVLRFAPQGMTAKVYDQIIDRLEQAGAGSPPGRLYHVCFGSSDNLRVSDIWESRESFEKFGETLIPILRELGVDSGQPEELQVHNIIEGSRTSAAQR
jgi:hypothetical protein